MPGAKAGAEEPAAGRAPKPLMSRNDCLRTWDDRRSRRGWDDWTVEASISAGEKCGCRFGTVIAAGWFDLLTMNTQRAHGREGSRESPFAEAGELERAFWEQASGRTNFQNAFLVVFSVTSQAPLPFSGEFVGNTFLKRETRH